MTETHFAATNRGADMVTTVVSVLAIVLFARAAIAQSVPGPALTAAATDSPAAAAQPAPENLPISPPKISYVDGLLKIDALGSTLAEVLTRVAALAGVTIDVPASARNERMPIVELGPGPPRQILASLLSDSNFDYLIQSTEADPEKIQSVLLMPREKKGGGANGVDAPGRPSRSPYVRAGATPAKSEDAPAPDNSVPAQPENAALAAEAASSTQSEQGAPPPPPQPEQPMRVPLSQPDQSNLMRPANPPPPSNLSPQTINLQLQQMYQQRMQMIQQGQTVAPTVHE